MSTLSTPILVCGCHPQQKKLGLLGNRAGVRSGTGRGRNEPRTVYWTRKLKKYSKSDENIVQGQEPDLREFSVAKIGTG